MGTVQGIGTVTEDVRGSRYDRLKKIGKRMYIFWGIGNTVSVNKREKNNYLSSPFLSGSSAKAQVGRIFAKKPVSMGFFRVLGEVVVRWDGSGKRGINVNG